jgi:hypothetical protein
MAGDALKALSKLHQSQYSQPPAPVEEPYDDYMSAVQTDEGNMPMEDDSFDMTAEGAESPALDALRRIQAVNLAAHGQV